MRHLQHPGLLSVIYIHSNSPCSPNKGLNYLFLFPVTNTRTKTQLVLRSCSWGWVFLPKHSLPTTLLPTRTRPHKASLSLAHPGAQQACLPQGRSTHGMAVKLLCRKRIQVLIQSLARLEKRKARRG